MRRQSRTPVKPVGTKRVSQFLTERSHHGLAEIDPPAGSSRSCRPPRRRHCAGDSMSNDDRSRVARAAAGVGSQWRWHAVDLAVFGPRWAAGAEEGYSPEINSLCGQRCHHIAAKRGPFTDGSRWLRARRCEQCSWVVALSRGTVQHEIAPYLPGSADSDVIAAAESGVPDLLRRIFVAILADAPAGAAGQLGHCSDPLAHAVWHRLVVIGCPGSAVICAVCTFAARLWAGEREGVTTGGCVLGAPRSVLITLAHHCDVGCANSSDASRTGRIVRGRRL